MNELTLLSELVKIPSSYPQEEEISLLIEKKLQDLGFQVEKQEVEPGRYNVLASRGVGKVLLLFGHLDTVSKKEGWETDPYILTQKEDQLYGLGAWDMKAGLAAILCALEEAPKDTPLRLAFVVDEENYSVGMDKLIRSGWIKKEDIYGAIVPEPGFNYGHKGIALGRIGRPVYELEVKTQGGHVYLVNERPNAILEATKVLELIKNIPVVHHKQLGDSVLFPRLIQGASSSMAIPDYVKLEIEGQLVPPQTSDSVMQEIKDVFQKAKENNQVNAEVSIRPVERPTPFCEPYSFDSADKFIAQVGQVLEEEIGEKPTYYYRRSVGDENRVAQLGIPVVTIGPEGDHAHEANEWVSEKSLEILTSFFKKILSSKFE